MAVFFGYNPNTPPDADVWTEMKPLPTYIPGFYLASTTVLGPIRLRQLRVGSDSCKVWPCLPWCPTQRPLVSRAQPAVSLLAMPLVHLRPTLC